MSSLKRMKRLPSLNSIKEKRVAQEAPKSIVTITEAPGGGFTIGLGLHGARMEELNPGESHPVSIVDIIALAISNVVRTGPEAFHEAVKQVVGTLQTVNQQIGEGVDVDTALAQADAELAGAVSDVDA